MFMIFLIDGLYPELGIDGLYPELGIYDLLFHSTVTTQTTDLFIYSIGAIELYYPINKSTNLNSLIGKRFIRVSAKAHLTLSPQLKEVIVGSMLRGFELWETKFQINSRLQFKQSLN
jgi:hypothetical protein